MKEKREKERERDSSSYLSISLRVTFSIVKVATGSTRAGRNDDFHVVLSKEVCTSRALRIDSSIASRSVSLLCRTRNFGCHVRIGKLDSRAHNTVEMMLQYRESVGRMRAYEKKNYFLHLHFRLYLSLLTVALASTPL